MKKEIVFGPSVAGTLRKAQFTGGGDFPEHWLLKNPHNDMLITKMNQEMMEKWNNSRPIGGRSEDIVFLEFALEYGDITEKTPGKRRYESIYKMLSTMHPEELNGTIAKEWLEDIKKNNRRGLKALKEAMESGESLRIWYSSHPTEINSFYWLMSFLDSKKYYDKVSAVYVAADNWIGSSYRRCWAQMGEELWFDAMKQEKIVAEEQIRYCAKRWHQLQKENASLRMCVSGNIISLPNEFLDGFIRNTVGEMPKTFKIAQLVGKVMSDHELMLGDAVIFAGVKRLIEQGDLVLVEEWQERIMQTRVDKS